MTFRGFRLRRLLPTRVRHLPADLAAVTVVVFLTNLAVFTPVVTETPLRIGVGLVFVLFVPGYTLTAILFPGAGTVPSKPETDDDTSETDDESGATSWVGNDGTGIDGMERVALSFGLSIVVVPLVSLVLNVTPWGIQLTPIMVSLSVLTLGFAWVAAERRWALPVDDRFRVPYRTWLSAGWSELRAPETNADLAFTLLLVVSILLLVGSIGYVVGVPNQGDSFTEFYLLTENKNGELVAGGQATNMTQGEGTELYVGVSNHEHQRVNYTVVTELQRVEVDNASDGTIVVDNEAEVGRFHVLLSHNETRRQPLTVSPTMSGQNLRLEFLLYRGDVPADPSASTASMDLHRWVNVTVPPDDST